MVQDSYAFSGFSVKDQKAAQKFYSEVLGLKVEESPMGLQLHTKGNNPIFIYEKADHTPASFTILNFPVEDIDKAVDALTKQGVVFEHYDFGGYGTDDKGIMRGRATNDGPDIAWFKDPSGNVLSILQD